MRTSEAAGPGPASTAASAEDARRTRVAIVAVCVAAIVPYLFTIDDYFVRDDFGVVQLLAQKPATYFPKWFYTSWMDFIWGYTPDEVRPFPAVSYQLTALGGAASPVLHHVLNIVLHAINGLLVFAIARAAASLSIPAAAFAAVLFVMLPVHTEGVAWITGRVDSMPSLFYMASFLAFVRWRQTGRIGLYGWALAAFFVALFTKQNTITMVGTLVAYDVLVLRKRPWPVPAFVGPYVPFAIMTAGYLWLRYLLFGEVAREGTLNAQGLMAFADLVTRHLTHVILGDFTSSHALMAGVLVLVALVSIALPRAWARLLYFGPVWWSIGVVPVLVAGYASPRHVYLAAVGWALVLAIVADEAMRLKAGAGWRRIVSAAAVVVLLLYIPPLVRSIREWTAIADVSQKAVRDVRAESLAAREGALVVVGAPSRSWDWALPFAISPPFTPSDLRDRVAIVSPRSLACCSSQWFDETRATLMRWSAGPARDAVVVLHWDQETGELAKVTSADNAQLPELARAMLDFRDPAELDRNLLRIIEVMAPLRPRRAER